MRLECATLLRPRTAARAGAWSESPSGTPPGCMRLEARIRGYRRRGSSTPGYCLERLRRLVGRGRVNRPGRRAMRLSSFT